MLSMQNEKEQQLEVTFLEGIQPGLVWFELQTGCLLSGTMHVLVCSDIMLAAEVNQMDSQSAQGITLDLSLLLSSRLNPGAMTHHSIADR